MKSFKDLMESGQPAADFVAPADDDKEATTLKARSKGEQDFVDAHVTAKADHPVAQDNQFTSSGKQDTSKETHPNSEAPKKIDFSTFMKRAQDTQTPARRGDKRQGDLKPVTPGA
jgi:hypothetical protein